MNLSALRKARAPGSLWPWLACSAVLGAMSAYAVVGAAGEPAVPLDDAFIHLQYARSFARATPFIFSPGAPAVPGATSLAWPLLLAPAFAVGLEGTQLIVVAWALGWVALALLAREVWLTARPLLGEGYALLAGGLVFCCSAYSWFAGSGMEVVPLAWLLTRSARRTADWLDGVEVSPAELIALAWAAAWMRPEGALAGVGTAATLALTPRGRSRALAALALLSVLGAPLVNLAFTGQASTTTSQAKWLLFNPYYDLRAIVAEGLATARYFVGEVLSGRVRKLPFIPVGSQLPALLALPALVVVGYRRDRRPRAWLLVALGAAVVIPMTYECFGCNRLRYVWPFGAPWLIGLAALAQLLGSGASRLHSRLAIVGPLSALLAVAGLGLRLPLAIRDLATSAAAVTRQQVSLARWARDSVADDALLGVNDTGAIAYFSNKRVFDVVGLTTRDEVKYWAAGAGSRFEHYERLGARRLPSHFIVYPDWFALDALLGPCATERVVRASNLGGDRMVACVADYRLLGSGAWAHGYRRVHAIDSLDVADLQSEAEHEYELFPSRSEDNRLAVHRGAADGGRFARAQEHFTLEVHPGGTIVARLGADRPTELRVSIGGRFAQSILVQEVWEELKLAVPSGVVAGLAEVGLEASADARFAAFHYWSYASLASAETL